jgi:hypothetical protein
MPPDAHVYGVVNCGFWEPAHNVPALEQMKIFALANGLRWGQGVAFGGGGAAAMVPGLLLRNLDRALTGLAGKIILNSGAPDHHIRINLPRPLYRLAANLQWRWLAWRNGLSGKDLYNRPW